MEELPLEGSVEVAAGTVLNLDECPDDWNALQGVEGDEIRVGQTLPQSGALAAFGAIANGVVRHHLGTSAAGLAHVASGVLEPALHDVFLASAGLAVTLLVIGALTALAALIPTLTRTIRSVPKPSVWQAELDARETELLAA